MSRFVRASKYRHVFGQQGKKEYGIDNVKVTNSAWDTNLIAASSRYISVNWNASGGGAFAILPLPSPFEPLPLASRPSSPTSFPSRARTRPVLDTDWSPFNDAMVASAGDDGLFHPTANNVLASTTGDHVPKAVLGGHGDAIQSLAFNPSGTSSHSARVVWMGERDNIATTGFSKMSDRQVAIWETGGLGNVKTTRLDQASGTLMPFWSDNNILSLPPLTPFARDGNIRTTNRVRLLYELAEYKSSDPQRGMCFLPRRALNISECEIARAYKLTASSIEPIAFIVPRKSDSFQSDIYPLAPSSEPALTAGEFFNGKTVPPNLVSLDTGAISAGAPPSAVPTPAPSTPAMTRSTSAPNPAPASVPSIAVDTTPSPVSAAVRKPEPSPVAATPFESRTPLRSQSGDESPLKEENARLTAELREARAQIRNLELQVESIKANARKAAALLDS
ncbi:uncharacterized protein B0H18DRAFT_993591 [Fomitopsis serialis]|uniref:uncharacterized protein n=1 Tax=Fomitopsis serialis TaxID=139415 RepID=UPI0020082287|nr:uncharacterized protein B0H18DRAFT_993591 [Neoantrodia serialis]KAH9930195.1 hypothetical protein B0H18DRAFT_993591 [Neoantrodia serialis]